MSTQDIIILGGGIAGKTAALAFSQKGFKVLHIAADFGSPPNTQQEVAQNIPWESRVYAISQSSAELFKDLQIWQAISQESMQVVEQMRVFGDSGQIGDGLHFSAFEANLPNLAWIIESSAIERALDLATNFAKLIVRQTAKFESISLQNQLAIVNTTMGVFEAPLVVAADGANSGVRDQIGIEVVVKEYDHTAVIANFACEKPNLRTAYQWFLASGDVLALLPLSDQKVSMVWSTSQEQAKELKQLATNSPEEFCTTISSQAAGKPLEFLGKLRLLNTAQSYPLKRQRAKQLIGPAHDPKVVLIGDAAHVMHPLAGQGLNLGLRDIASLVKVFNEKEAYRKLNDRVLLRRFERSRAADVDSVLALTHHLHRLFLREEIPVKILRNMGMRLLNQNSQLKKQLIAQAIA